MADPAARWRVRTAGLVLSLAVHLVVLGAILAGLTVRPAVERRPVVVDLVPLDQPRRSKPARPSSVARSPGSTTPSLPASPIAPAPTASASSLPAAKAPGWPSDGDFGKARAALRGALGCAHPELVKLTDAERAACARKMAAGIDPNVAWPAPIAPEKRAWFDASVASHNEPGHLPAFGCAMGFDGLKLIKPRAPPHSVKLGPLPCFIVPPKGPFDDDVDVPPPSKNGPSYLGSPLKPAATPDFTGGGGPSY